ncbi:MAG: DUF1289 domain-containing protein [Pseudomonadota bacterium]|nr:DUF1289 domain-containing protein [Pseudomonadota bacterium]
MTLPPDLPAAVASPCIKVCVLDARSVCVGCGRTIDEITQWSRLTVEQQRLIVDRAEQRRREAAAS